MTGTRRWSVDVFNVYYDKYDEWYEEHPITYENELRLVEAVVEQYAGKNRDRCVEIGVGTGRFAAPLGCAYGVDPSFGMLLRARERGIHVIMGRAEQLPLASGAFRLALLIVTLCFVEDPEATISEAARVLARGGVAIACIVPRDTEWGQHYMALGGKGHPFYSRARFYTVEEVISLAEDQGLTPGRVIATLTYKPWEQPRSDKPRPYTGREGFACIPLRKN